MQPLPLIRGLLPSDEWVADIRAVRNQYAREHNLTSRDFSFDWKETSSLPPRR